MELGSFLLVTQCKAVIICAHIYISFKKRKKLVTLLKKITDRTFCVSKVYKIAYLGMKLNNRKMHQNSFYCDVLKRVDFRMLVFVRWNFPW